MLTFYIKNKIARCTWLRYGFTRVVVLVGPYAFKFARPLPVHTHFLAGCLANWRERLFCREFKTTAKDRKVAAHAKRVARSFWCSPFGLLQIAERCRPLPVGYKIKREDWLEFTTDVKPENFGLHPKTGKLVVLDYA